MILVIGFCYRRRIFFVVPAVEALSIACCVTHFEGSDQD